jgi:hypothetical protein
MMKILPYIMPRLTTILILFFSSYQVMAQEQDKAAIPFRAEIGVQANALFGRLLTDGENGLVQNPYLLTGKVYWGNIGLRVGLGGDHRKEIQRVDGFANTKTILTQRLDIRLGAERSFSLGDRWQGSLGVDAIANWTQDKTINDSGFDVITDTKDIQFIGGGPVFGLKYQVTKRLSFGTEGYVYYTVGNITDGQFFKNFPVGEDKTKKLDTRALQVGLPSALYLIFEF